MSKGITRPSIAGGLVRIGPQPTENPGLVPTNRSVIRPAKVNPTSQKKKTG